MKGSCMTQTISKVVMVALVLVGLAGCKDDPNPCDSTTYLSGSDCLPKQDAGPDVTVPVPDTAIPTIPDTQVATEAAAPVVDSELGEAGGGAGTAQLGDPCTDSVTNAECQGPDVDYCAIQPGTAGYCTKSGCVTAADCPTGWSCFDLSKMGITGYPTMCTKP